MPVTPLIQAAQAYPAMERLVLEAERSVWIAFRIFDPDTRLRSDEALALGLETWLDLIGHALDRGVRFHIRLTDFDPAGGPSLHRTCWRATYQLRALAKERGDLLTIFPAMHPHIVGPIAKTVFWPIVRHRIVSALQEPAGDSEPPDYQHMRDNGGVPLWPPQPIRPATHHEKVMIADGSRAILGGLDLNERRFDTEDHSRPADQTWHDVSLLIEGEDAAPCINDLMLHLAEGWNASEAIDPAAEPSALLASKGSPRSDQSDLSFISTQSRQRSGISTIAPDTISSSIEDHALALIGAAKELLYIETQFLRSRKIANAISNGLKRSPALNLVVVLPAAPDDVLFDSNDGSDARHGEWLQARCIQTIRRAAGPRALLVSPVGANQPTSDAQSADESRATVQSRWPIYVHSKVLIADCQRAIVSSANLNGRSLRWDTEAGVLWQDADAVRAFQMRLLNKHLSGSAELMDPASVIEIMHAVRQGSSGSNTAPLARYPHRRASRFAAPRFFVPDDMV